MILGPVGVETEFLFRSLALVHGDSEVHVEEVAGCRVFRAPLTVPLADGREVALSLFAASIAADFRAVFSLLFQRAEGVIALIPADTARVEEGRRILGTLQSQLLVHLAPEDLPPYLLQYQWRKEHLGFTPDVIDQSLGVNPDAVIRVFTHFNDESQIDGLRELVEMMMAQAPAAKA